MLAGVAVVLSISIYTSREGGGGWFGGTLGGGNPYEGVTLLRTPGATGSVSFLPPAVMTEGVVLAPLFFLELALETRVVSCTIRIYRDRDGDRLSSEGEALLEAQVGLLPREHGAWAPDGWGLVAPAEEALLRFRVVLDLGSETLSWQGVVVEAGPDDPRRAD